MQDGVEEYYLLSQKITKQNEYNTEEMVRINCVIR